MFHSRNPIYRNPVGAVADGQNIHFKIRLSRDLRCSSAILCMTEDTGGTTEMCKMFWCGLEGDGGEWWECDFAPETPGLYFYDFLLETWRGRLRLSCGFNGEGALPGTGKRWQLTVYRKDFQTPDWLAGGLIYQVFPDRFFRSGKRKTDVPLDRKLHQQWGEAPDWAPDEQGEITNTDYFGGDLRGIEEKLPYLKSLGVTCLYLNPIFESHSNHRYDTADYSKVDTLLGDERDFRMLCQKAAGMGIRVMLDGVFSHTGSDSVYFNRKGRYAPNGAYNTKESPYFGWYNFQNWPDQYECWWDFITLPNVQETNAGYLEYINGKNGIIRKWLRAGAAAWRLDVADELPDEFIDALSAATTAEKPDALVLGEVWEDASNKCAYGQRRRYLLGGQLDTVMNYPFRSAIIGFLTGQKPSDMMELILSVLENYPPQVIRLLMNHIGTHDTERILTALVGEPSDGRDRQWQSAQKLSPEQREKGLSLLRLASLMQYTLPGVPSLYYGDEAGMEGCRDPFNRACYPWGSEDTSLVQWYRLLGCLRGELIDPLAAGEFHPVMAGNDCMAWMRIGEKRCLLTAVNRGTVDRIIVLDSQWIDAKVLLGGGLDGRDATVPACGCLLLVLNKE